MADGGSPTRHGRRAFVTSASTYSVIVAAQTLAPLLITPLLTRSLSVAEFGESILAVVLAQVLAVLLNAGLPAAVSRLYFQSEVGEQAARSLVFRGLAPIGALGVVAAGAAAWSTTSWLPLPVVIVLVAIAGSLLLAVFEVNQSLMRSRGQTKAFAVWTVVGLVCSQVFGLLAVLADGGALGFVVGWTIGTGVATLGSVLVVRPLPGAHGAASAAARLGPALRIGLPSAVYATVLTSLVYVDRFVLSALHGPAASGRYQLAYTVGGVTIAAMGAVNLAWGPEVFRSLRTGASFLTETTVDLAIAMVVLVGVGVALAPIGVAILAPPDYDRRGITAAACLIMPLGALQLLHYSRTHLLTWRGRLSAMIPVSVGAAALHLLGNIVLDRAHPLTGPPTVSLVTFSLLALALSLLSRSLGAGPGVPPVAWIATGAAIAIGVLGCWATFAGVGWVTRSGLIALSVLVAGVLLLARRRNLLRPEPSEAA